MKKEEQYYESPELEVLIVSAETPLASSPLENPEEGGEWDWA